MRPVVLRNAQLCELLMLEYHSSAESRADQQLNDRFLDVCFCSTVEPWPQYPTTPEVVTLDAQDIRHDTPAQRRNPYGERA